MVGINALDDEDCRSATVTGHFHHLGFTRMYNTGGDIDDGPQSAAVTCRVTEPV